MTKEKIIEALENRFYEAEISTYEANDKDGTCFTDDGNIHYTYGDTRYCLDFGQNYPDSWFNSKERVISNFFKNL